MCSYYILIIYLFVSRHLGGFHLLAIVNNDTINMGVQIPAWDPALISFGYVPRSGITRYWVILFLIFLEIPIVFFILAIPFYITSNSAKDYVLANTCYFQIFNFFLSNHSHPNEHMVISQYCLALHFPNDEWYGTPFHVFFCPSPIF